MWYCLDIMESALSFVVGLLTAALSLLGFVQQHPELPQSSRDQAQQVAQQAITQAKNALTNNVHPNATAQSSNSTASRFATPMTGAAPLTVTFVAPPSAGGDYMYFGDGADGCSVPVVVRDEMGCSVPSGIPIAHTYTKPGVYDASVGRHLPSTILASATITVTGNATNQVSGSSVPGMTKYTDTDFGFSFWYPSGWAVGPDRIGHENLEDCTIKKSFSVQGSTSSTGVTIAEYYCPNLSMTLRGANGANPVGMDFKYYFDKTIHTWMVSDLSDPPNGSPRTTRPMDVSNNTMGELHIFPGAARFGGDVVIPLSARNFLIISSNDGGMSLAVRPFAKTVLATDPSVATPVSAQEQTKVIQAEASAYAGL